MRAPTSYSAGANRLSSAALPSYQTVSPTPTPTPESLRQMMAQAAAAATAASNHNASVGSMLAFNSYQSVQPLPGSSSIVNPSPPPSTPHPHPHVHSSMMNSISNSRRALAASRKNNGVSQLPSVLDSEGDQRGAPLIPVADGMRKRRILQVTEELKKSYRHPANSQQIETETLHRLRAILFMNRTLVTQSFVSHVTGVSQGSLSQFVRGFFRGNQRNVDIKLEHFVENFANGEYDSYLEEIRSGVRTSIRPMHFPTITQQAAQAAQQSTGPVVQPQTSSSLRKEPQQSSDLNVQHPSNANGIQQSAPIPAPQPPQLHPPPWKQTQQQQLEHNFQQHQLQLEQQLKAQAKSQVHSQIDLSSIAVQQQRNVHVPGVGVTNPMGATSADASMTATERAAQSVADQIAGLIAKQGSSTVQADDASNSADQEHGYRTRRRKRMQRTLDPTNVAGSTSPPTTVPVLPHPQPLQQQGIPPHVLQQQLLQKQQMIKLRQMQQPQALPQQRLHSQQHQQGQQPQQAKQPDHQELQNTSGLLFPSGPKEEQLTPMIAVERAFHTLVASEWSFDAVSAEPLLIPIEISVLHEGFIMHTYTQWDVNERRLSPEIAAERLRRARSLPPSFTPLVAAQIRRALFEAGVPCAAPPGPDGATIPEKRVMLHLRVKLPGGNELIDNVEWDIANFQQNSPELFSRQICMDEGLPAWVAVNIAKALRGQLAAAQAIVYGDEETQKLGNAVFLRNGGNKTQEDQSIVLPTVKSALSKISPELERDENKAFVSKDILQPLLDDIPNEAMKRVRDRKDREAYAAYKQALKETGFDRKKRKHLASPMTAHAKRETLASPEASPYKLFLRSHKKRRVRGGDTTPNSIGNDEEGDISQGNTVRQNGHPEKGGRPSTNFKMPLRLRVKPPMYEFEHPEKGVRPSTDFKIPLKLRVKPPMGQLEHSGRVRRRRRR